MLLLYTEITEKWYWKTWYINMNSIASIMKWMHELKINVGFYTL